MLNNENKHLLNVANHFCQFNKVISIDPITIGNINSTYLVTYQDNKNQHKFILQKISPIFLDLKLLNQNHSLITDHIEKKLKGAKEFPSERIWRLPRLIEISDNAGFIYESRGESWRAMEYINSYCANKKLLDASLLKDIGAALGFFHCMVADFNDSILHPSIPHFHDTSFYIDRFNLLIRAYDFESKNLIKYHNRVKSLSEEIRSQLPNAIKSIHLIRNEFTDKHVVHGDPKLSNFLVDRKTGYVISLIDLDTVSHGFRLNDVADCLRSACKKKSYLRNGADLVIFDLDLCEELLTGYFLVASRLYSKKQLSYLPHFIYLISLELGIRFFNDFLDCNQYFKTEYFSQNLDKAEEQLGLMNSLVMQWDPLVEMIAQVSSACDSFK